MSAEKKTTPLGKSEREEPERFIPDGMGMFQRNVKRMGDCTLAFLALIVFSPLFLLCYIAVKREDGGPAIFKQERIGRFGRPFNIYKFRSMRLDAEKFGPALYKGGADLRMTRIGKFLRIHHLDELPQLWNVFVGDMSFIGPRPERQFYIDQIMERDPPLSLPLPDPPGRDLLRHALQWLYGHVREDASSFTLRLVLSGASLVVVRFQDIGEDFLEYSVREEILNRDNQGKQFCFLLNQNTMKKVLKGWLIDNEVTTDNKTDKILLLASVGSLTLDDVLEEMQK